MRIKDSRRKNSIPRIAARYAGVLGVFLLAIMLFSWPGPGAHPLLNNNETGAGAGVAYGAEGDGPFTLIINTTGNGTVEKSPDQETYASGDVVTLTAAPTEGWAFSGWSGDLTGNTNPYDVVMTDNKTITATFTEQEYELIIRIVGEGSITIDPEQATYAPGTSVNLTATADEGWYFHRWSGYHVWPGGVSDAYTPSTTIVMDTHKTVNVYFYSDADVVEIPDANLREAITDTLGKSPSDNISSSELALITRLDAYDIGVTDLTGLEYCANLEILKLYQNSISDISPLEHCTSLTGLGLEYNQIEDITPLVNNAGLGAGTTIWIEHNLLDLGPGPDTDNIATLQARGVNIVYNPQDLEPSPCILTTVINGQGTVQCSPASDNHSYEPGSMVDISAAAATNWKFLNWTGDVADPNSANTTVTMDTHKTVTANFARTHGILILATNGNGTVTPAAGEHTYESGYTVYITATADAGWQFDGWTGDVGAIADVNAAETSVVMNDDYSIAANFSAISTAPSDSGGGGGWGGAVRGVTTLAVAMTPDGKLVADINAPSSDLRVYLTLHAGTICTSGSNGVPVYWIYIIAVPGYETVPGPPEGYQRFMPYYRMEPAGTVFDPPVTCTFKYTDAELPEGTEENNLVVMLWNPESEMWVLLDTQVDPVNNRVSTQIGRFSLYTVMVGNRPADIDVTEISVVPHEIIEGEQASINAVISNRGDLSGTYEAVLKVNEAVAEIRELTIKGGASVIVSFELSGLENGDYRITLGGLETDFSVLPLVEPAPASFELSSLTINPAEADIGDEVEIRVTVTNTGELEGIYGVELDIDGKIVETREVQLDGKASESLIFALVADTAGKKLIRIGELLSSLAVAEVEQPPEEASPPPDEPAPAETIEPAKSEPSQEQGGTGWWITVIIVAVCAAAITGGYFIWRRKRKTPGSPRAY